MIIFLDSTLGDNIDGFTNSEFNALEHIAQSACQGHHFVLIDGDLAKLLIGKLDKFSARASAFFRREYEFLSTSPRHLLDRSSVVIRVCNVDCIAVSSEKSQTIIQCPLRDLDSSTILQPVTLACEDLNDCELFAILANHYRSRLHLQAFQIRVTYANLGGSGAERVIPPLIREERIFLVITDSDKSFKEDKLGDSARSVCRTLNNTNHKLHAHIILNCREIENLLPDRVLQTIFAQNKRCLELLNKFTEANLYEPRLYGDFKEGITLQQLRNYALSANESMRTKFKDIEAEFLQHHNPLCMSDPECMNSECTCIVFPSNGGKESTIAKRSINELNRMNGRELWDELCSAHLQELNRVLSAIVFWGFASNPVRA
jgi:hypothetical protein